MPASQNFSVVITSYNYISFVAEAVESALGQSLPPLEVIVIDDGSTDGTPAYLAERYGGHASVRIIATENRGQLAAFGEGARAARGEVIAFLDADDLWEADYLACIAAVYSANPAVDFVYTNMRFFGTRNDLFLKDAVNRDLGLSILLGAYRTRWQATATSAISLKRKLALELLDVPGWMTAAWRTRADDCIVCGADILGGRKYFLAEPLVKYRAHGNNAWLAQKMNGEKALRHWLRADIMIAHYRGVAQLDAALRAQHLRHVKHEFRSKPTPTREDLSDYLQLLSESSLPWGARWEHRFALWRHYLKRPR